MKKNREYNLQDFCFELPEELIAQYPAGRREESRLFVLNRKSGKYEHRYFHEIMEYLKDGDLLILNNAKVIPARIFFMRETGGVVEIVLIRQIGSNRWLVLSNRTGRLRINEELAAVSDLSVKIRISERVDNYLAIETNTEFNEETLNRIGKIPLPPYIRRELNELDIERYQTVYASMSGAAASPTAGLHFSDSLIESLKGKGVLLAYLTLYVSWGTFQPVRAEDLSLHRMYSEDFILPESTAMMVNSARLDKRRIIAVGTTALRVLESTYSNGINRPGRGVTDIFIYPPHRVESIDHMITNFHTPYSTLLMLVSAFAGFDSIMRAYREAVEMRYRFFSYGDAMFII